MRRDGCASDIHRNAIRTFCVAWLQINDFTIVPERYGNSPAALAQCLLEASQYEQVDLKICKAP
ncbi:MAG TPA: hypothetical protein VF434_08795, partial [Promineifilum sp.]